MRAFRVAYDGTGYRGFQRQPHGDTVEDELFGALGKLGVGFEDGSPVGYAAAGRTDAGVSARAQTVAFETPSWLGPRAFNGELPESIRAWGSADVPASFHATHDAERRLYRYFLYAEESDEERAEIAAQKLSGEHDFHNFTPDEEGTERTVSVSVRRNGPFLVVDCRASGFARQLVRRLVSAIEAVAERRRPPSFIDRALLGDPLSGPNGIAPADPGPLLLFDVQYPGVAFEIDESARSSAERVFERRRRRRLAGARVAGELFPDGCG